jgi:uncharacterized protein YegP (UPF0339 family)
MAEGPGFYIYVDRGGQYRWRLAAANNQVVADSAESYVSRNGVLQSVERMKQLINDPDLHVHDETRLTSK